MLTDANRDLIRRAQAIYDERLRDELERTSHGQCVSIEPDSGDHFLGANYSQSIRAARSKYPDRLSYTIRIGYPSVVEIGYAV